MTNIKVAIVDEDFSWIKQITDLINKNEDLLVLWVADSKETAINHAKVEEVDVILMDNKFACDGRDTVDFSAITKAKIIMMTASVDDELIRNSITHGAVNYIIKKDYESIPVLIRLAYSQTSPVEVIFRAYHEIKCELELNELTVTEKELYTLKKQGYSIKQIAIETHKSEGTIRNQLSKVNKKIKNKQ